MPLKPYITLSQRRVYDFMVLWRKNFGCSPTMMEMAKGLLGGPYAKVTVYEWVKELEKKGFRDHLS